jgi:hypothetical protein
MELETTSRFYLISRIDEKYDREMKDLKQIVNSWKFGFIILLCAEASK